MEFFSQTPCLYYLTIFIDFSYYENLCFIHILHFQQLVAVLLIGIAAYAKASAVITSIPIAGGKF